MSALTYGRGETDKEKFWLRFAAATRAPLSWKQELFAAAREIGSRATKPIWVAFSGGIDSEVACRAFKAEKIPFSVLTLEHAGGTNAHDTAFAKKWCADNGVSHEVVEIDIESFLKVDVERYAETYVAIHPFRYLQLKLMEMVEERGGYAVLCSGEQLYVADRSREEIRPEHVHMELSNGTVMPLEWCKARGSEHEPYFHYATPELCLAYTRLPLINFALSNPDPLLRHPANTYALKRIAYHAEWPDMTVRYKHDGFERIRPLFRETQDKLKKRFLHEFVRVDMPVPTFIEQLTGSVRA
jgi:hypothetical protein